MGTSNPGLTTHVLDTACGKPAAGLTLVLSSLDSGKTLTRRVTNDDGRCDEPLLSGETFQCGTYELLFHAGDYLRNLDPSLTDPLFLDLIPVRFTITDTRSHYHVPLLLSPYSYSTYRGS